MNGEIIYVCSELYLLGHLTRADACWQLVTMDGSSSMHSIILCSCPLHWRGVARALVLLGKGKL